MISLQHPYISVAVQNGVSYGGGQQYSDDAMVRRCGCGIIAATDLMLYLNRWHMAKPAACLEGLLSSGEVLPFSEYQRCILFMNRKYFPMIPYAGINGLMLMAGVQRFFREHQMPFSAHWCFAQSRLWERTEIMLRQDIPIIMAVGPNFPILWGQERVGFYIRTQEGRYIPVSGAKSHFFTVTGLDESWLRISSWGRRYYLNRWEFVDYIRRQNAGFTSNVLLIERK